MGSGRVPVQKTGISPAVPFHTIIIAIIRSKLRTSEGTVRIGCETNLAPVGRNFLHNIPRVCASAHRNTQSALMLATMTISCRPDEESLIGAVLFRGDGSALTIASRTIRPAYARFARIRGPFVVWVGQIKPPNWARIAKIHEFPASGAFELRAGGPTVILLELCAPDLLSGRFARRLHLFLSGRRAPHPGHPLPARYPSLRLPRLAAGR